MTVNSRNCSHEQLLSSYGMKKNTSQWLFHSFFAITSKEICCCYSHVKMVILKLREVANFPKIFSPRPQTSLAWTSARATNPQVQNLYLHSGSVLSFKKRFLNPVLLELIGFTELHQSDKSQDCNGIRQRTGDPGREGGLRVKHRSLISNR